MGRGRTEMTWLKPETRLREGSRSHEPEGVPLKSVDSWG